MNIGVIFAGGVGTRMYSKDRPKQFLKMYNKPIIIYTLEHFEINEEIDAIVIACVEEWIPYLEKLLYKYRIEKVRKIVPGGETGQLSIYNGLKAAKEISRDEENIVLIHDGVRPLITSELLSENIKCVKKYGSAITAGVVTETIVIVDEIMNIERVPTRAKSRVAKAPQSFMLKDILSVHEQALADGLNNSIDSCSLMKQYGKELHMIDGPYENIKITTPQDFYIMRAILEAKENSQI
ncbi:MAG: 2-C-methyl-D-erythritol 4-phosphate cytidylyltransferase, partial [Lachnospiraceae bacterium]|nr:2-C-methyl-D-erythritol 4-phosphate cytidylyltransferase [Lachnospiraceae bacterium]